MGQTADRHVLIVAHTGREDSLKPSHVAITVSRDEAVARAALDPWQRWAA